ncbi:hypothetical protein BDAP_001451 [Binucleata daphniae]
MYEEDKNCINNAIKDDEKDFKKKCVHLTNDYARNKAINKKKNSIDMHKNDKKDEEDRIKDKEDIREFDNYICDNMCDSKYDEKYNNNCDKEKCNEYNCNNTNNSIGKDKNDLTNKTNSTVNNGIEKNKKNTCIEYVNCLNNKNTKIEYKEEMHDKKISLCTLINNNYENMQSKKEKEDYKCINNKMLYENKTSDSSKCNTEKLNKSINETKVKMNNGNNKSIGTIDDEYINDANNNKNEISDIPNENEKVTKEEKDCSNNNTTTSTNTKLNESQEENQLTKVKKRRFIRYLTHPLLDNVREETNEFDAYNINKKNEIEDMREENFDSDNTQNNITESRNIRYRRNRNSIYRSHINNVTQDDDNVNTRDISHTVADNMRDDANQTKAYVNCTSIRDTSRPVYETREIIEYSPCGKYCRFADIIGYGKLRTIYLGFDLQQDAEVFWHVVDDKLNNCELSINVDVLKNLNHAKLIKFRGTWTKEDTMIVITEFMPFGTLKEWLKLHKPTPDRILDWSHQILQGIEYLHKNNIVHGDIRSDNIYIDMDREIIKIGDLGLANKYPNKRDMDVDTHEFMARELIEGDGYSKAVDMYAFGMVLLEFITSECPYEECKTSEEIYKKIMQKIPPEIILKVENACCRKIILDCLAPEYDRLTIRECINGHFYQQDFYNPILSDIFKKTREYEKIRKRQTRTNKNYSDGNNIINTYNINNKNNINSLNNTNSNLEQTSMQIDDNIPDTTSKQKKLFNNNLIDEKIESTKCVLGFNGKYMPTSGCRKCVEYFKTYEYMSFTFYEKTNLSLVTIKNNVLELQLYCDTNENFYKFAYDVKKDTYGSITTDIIDELIFSTESKDVIFELVEQEFGKLRDFLSKKKDIPEIIKIWLDSDPLYVVELDDDCTEYDKTKKQCNDCLNNSNKSNTDMNNISKLCTDKKCIYYNTCNGYVCNEIENKLSLDMSFTNNTSIQDFVNKVAMYTKRDLETATSWIETLKEQEIEKVSDLLILVDEDWSKFNLTIFSSRAMKNMLFGKDKHPIKEKDLEINEYEIFYNEKDNVTCIKQFISNVCTFIKKEQASKWTNKLLKQDVRTVEELKCLTDDDLMRLELSVYGYRVLKNIINRKGKIIM